MDHSNHMSEQLLIVIAGSLLCCPLTGMFMCVNYDSFDC